VCIHTDLVYTMAAVLRRVLATQLPMLARNSTAHALVAATGVAGLQSAATGARYAAICAASSFPLTAHVDLKSIANFRQ
jgi:hypothetical protein